MNVSALAAIILTGAVNAAGLEGQVLFGNLPELGIDGEGHGAYRQLDGERCPAVLVHEDEDGNLLLETLLLCEGTSVRVCNLNAAHVNDALAWLAEQH